MLFYLPILVYVISAIGYQFVAKTVPSATNPFAMLTIVYGIATVACFGLTFLTKGGETLGQAFSPMPLTVIFLGIAVVGLEASTIYAYRLGWQVSVFPTVIYMTVIVGVLILGALVFKEKLTAKKLLGAALCLAGLLCMRMK